MKKIIIILLSIGILGGGFYYYYNENNKNEPSKEYEVFNIERTTFTKIVEADGVVHARDSKLIYVDRSMKVDQVFYTTGDYVKKGEIIMTFDQGEKNSLRRNLRREEITNKKLQRDLENEKALLKVGGSHKVNIENIEYDIERSQLLIEEYQEELSKILDNIRSPFDGTITSMIAEANYRVNTQVELFEISDLSNLIVVANIPEYNISGISIGQEAKIETNLSQKQIKGVVTKLSTLSSATPTSSSSNNSSSASTGTNVEAYVSVEITLDKLPAEIRPGFNAKVNIVLDTKDDIIAIPRTSILEDAKGYYVFILNEESNIQKNYIKIIESNNDVMIISNLRDGLKVLKNPYVALKEGDKVQEGKSGQGQGGGQGKGNKSGSDGNG